MPLSAPHFMCLNCVHLSPCPMSSVPLQRGLNVHRSLPLLRKELQGCWYISSPISSHKKTCLRYLINLSDCCPTFTTDTLLSATAWLSLPPSLPLFLFIVSTAAKVIVPSNSWLWSLLFSHGLYMNVEIPQGDPSYILLSFILCSSLPGNDGSQDMLHTRGFYSSHPLWLIVPFPHETLPLLFSQFPAQTSSPNVITSWKRHHYKCTPPSPLPASYPKHFLWACFDTCSDGLLFFVKPWGSKGQEWDLSYLCIASTNKALQNHYRESICPVSDRCGIGGNRSASSTLLSNFSHYRREGDVLPPVPQITKTRKMNFSVLETETPFLLLLTLTTLHTTPYRNHQGPAGEIIHNNFIHSLQFMWHYSETLTSILLLWGSSRRRILHSFLPCHRQLLAWVWSLEPWKQRDTIR